jgi:hypothetical protein
MTLRLSSHERLAIGANAMEMSRRLREVKSIPHGYNRRRATAVRKGSRRTSMSSLPDEESGDQIFERPGFPLELVAAPGGGLAANQIGR